MLSVSAMSFLQHTPRMLRSEPHIPFDNCDVPPAVDSNAALDRVARIWPRQNTEKHLQQTLKMLQNRIMLSRFLFILPLHVQNKSGFFDKSEENI